MAAGNVRRADFAEHQAFSAGVYHLTQLFIQLSMRGDGGLLDEDYPVGNMGERLLQNGQAVKEVAGNLRRVKDGKVDVLPIGVVPVPVPFPLPLAVFLFQIPVTCPVAILPILSTVAGSRDA